ncbi:SMC-Scp complex subunit ScpB [bacterium]|nr:SMC-Scp complex subunit ScpB [bacterium]
MKSSQASAWKSTPANTSGWNWWFRVRSPTATPDTLSLRAEERQGIRSVKMARLEAALLVADGPLTLRRLTQVATLAETQEAAQLIEQLNAAYDAEVSPFRIERVATGYQLLTRHSYALWLSRLHQRQVELKLSAAALETLTILAYRQPLTRADLETLRGVQCTDLLKLLMDRGLVRIAGQDDSLGRPYLYETTRKFLETYGLRSLDDLPFSRELRIRKESTDTVEADAA